MKTIYFIYLFFPFFTFSQNNWYFGNGNRLDFTNKKNPTNIKDGILSQDRISSIDNETGKLAFYTDGMTVVNHQHKIIKNGTNLLGQASNIIVPYPQKKGIYYIFSISIDDTQKSMFEKIDLDTSKMKRLTPEIWSQELARRDTVNQKRARLYYHLVDMNKNNGMGEVVVKNQLMYQSITSCLTVARHANGKNFWLITHEFMNNHFRVYLINEKGLQDKFISNKVGINTYTQNYGIYNDNTLRLSSDFNYLALAEKLGHTIDIFKFDNDNGKIESFISIREKDIFNYRGLEFSPDASKLYVTFSNFANTNHTLKQYNLKLTQTNIIKYSKKKIYLYREIENDECIKQDLRLGVDGKIYSLHGAKPFVSRIENPNEDWENLQFHFKKFKYEQGSLFFFSNNTHLLPPFFSPIKIDELFSRQILFDTKQSKIESWHAPILVDIFQFLEDNKDTKITIIGHTDNEGNPKENQKLSLERAKSIADYFVNKKIDKNRIKVEGLGDTKPIIDNDNEENKSKNRRVEFLIEKIK